MPSITYWSRLEPRPRSRSLSTSLAAHVRDPAWLLTRQWQLGEFQGEDAGSPAFVELASRTSQLTTLHAGDTATALDSDQPVEPASLGESNDSADQILAAELGAVFEAPLRQASRLDLINLFRTSYPIEPPSAEVVRVDPAGARVLQVLAGRRTNGLRLYAATLAAAPDLPTPTIDTADETPIRAALAELHAMAKALGIGHRNADALSWRPERLDYAFDAVGHAPNGNPIRLRARSRRDGALAWHAFDIADAATEGDVIEPSVRRSAVIPTNVTFRGMPNARFWSFENGRLNIAAVKPEKRELGKLLVLDFLLLHGVDWYLAPVRQPLGSLAEIESITVQDVFGSRTTVPRAGTGLRRTPWTLYTLSRVTGEEPASFLFLAPTAGEAAQRSEPIEEARFARDEGANLAWAIERTVPNAVGDPASGHEQAQRARPSSAEAEVSDASADVSYRVQTDVPVNWYPLLPVAVDPGNRQVSLQRGVILRDADDASAPEPVGRILRPSAVGAEPYRLDEETLPRIGVVVSRSVYRTRWTDGSTHVWVARRMRRGSGEESSGLRFDVLEER